MHISKNASKGIFLFPFLILMLFLNYSAEAQRPFGNEWIEFGQPYYKVKVAKNGVYRINYSDLLTAGWKETDEVWNQEVQVWYRGKQVPIYVNSPNDSLFVNGAYVEFYGQRNDGAMDTVFYPKAEYISHTYHSTFTDTSSYFLTYSYMTESKRIQENKYVNTSKPHVNTIIAEKLRYFADGYADGAQIIPMHNFGTPEYTANEGYQSFGIAKGQSREFGINTNTPDISSSTLPTIEFRIQGRSDYWLNGVDISPDHNLIVEIKPQSGTARVLLDTAYNGFATILKTFTLNWSDLGNKTMLKVTPKGVPNSVSDVISVAYFRIKYPKKLNTSEFLNDTFFHINNSADTLTHFVFFSGTNSAAAKYKLYDVTNGYRATGNVIGDSLHFTIKNSGQKNLYHLYDSTQYTVLIPQKVEMKDYDLFENYNMLIISNKALWESSVQYYGYKKGRKIDSVVINPLLVDVEDLYNSFFYGIQHHPAAIQNFCNFVYKKAEKKPEYLLLIGKGHEPWAVRTRENLNLMPAIGVPNADLMFTAGIDNNFVGLDLTLDPHMAIGRLPATNNEDVLAYLNKLKEYDNLPKVLWRKNIIHVGGGTELNIQQEAKSILNKIKIIAEGPYTGANVRSYFAETSDVINGDKRAAIQYELESGSALLTYFGHASGTVLGVEIANFTTLNNRGKYPIMYLNGCNVGNASLPSRSMGEDYVLAPNKGSMSWIGHTNTTYTGALEHQMTLFYQQMAKDDYGGTIGNAWRRSLAKTSFTTEAETRAFEYSWNVMGDPTVEFPFMALPDYAISDTSIKISPENTTANSESFDLAIPVANLGKTDTQKITIKVRHISPDGATHIYPVIKMLPPSYLDTVFFNIQKGNKQLQGLNKFEIWIDADSIITEESESNNFVQFERFLPGTGVRLIYPLEYGIEPSSTIKLVAQSRNLLDTATQILFEVDTVPYFNSPFVKKSGIINGKNIVEYQVNLPADDSMVYYWRARLNLPADSGGFWEMRSFTYINGSQNGWSQSHFAQFADIEADDVNIDTAQRYFSFNALNKFFNITSNAFHNANTGIKPEDDVGFTPCVFKPRTLAFIEFDRNTIKPVDTFPTSPCGHPVFWQGFDMRTATDRAKFVQAIDTVKDGNYVGLISNGNAQNFTAWEPEVYAAFKKLGSVIIDTLKSDPTAFVIAGIKQPVNGILLDEDSRRYKVHVAGDTARIRVNFKGVGTPKGSIKSEIIGRASQWKTVYLHFISMEPNSADTKKLSIIGITNSGFDTVLAKNITDTVIDISWIDAGKYPFIKLQVFLEDIPERSPAQLKMWTVLYEGVPEGTLLIDNNYSFNERVSRGDSIQVKIMYKNISKYPMHPVLVNYRINDNAGTPKISDTDTMAALLPGEHFNIDKSFATDDLAGAYNFVLQVNPDYAQPEVTIDNNILRTNFNVVSDEENPLLDVTFDKRHIKNNEIVSTNTHIEIVASDNNTAQLMNDTSQFFIYLRKPGEDTLLRYYFSNSQIQFTPATATSNKAYISFKPGPLSDGTYEFTVYAKDAAGNPSGSKPYNITFKVINKSAVSNFYVYPNPVSTSGAKFVFTITGSSIPQIHGIAIYNLNGKLVSGITSSQFKNIVVGTNEIWWNATDMNGAPLTNGLYFYRVITEPANLERHLLPEDRQLDNGYGKLLILRDRP